MTLLGQFALWAAFLIGLWSAGLAFFARWQDRPELALAVRRGAYAVCIALLVAAAALALEALVMGTGSARRALRVKPEMLVGTGVLILMTSGVLGFFAGKPFLTGIWHEVSVPLLGHLELGSPLLFDAGVFVTVVGVVLTIAFSLMEVR